MPGPDDEGAPLARTQSNNTNTTSVGNDSPSPTGAWLVSGGNSPDLDPLDSPAMSEDEDKDGDGEKAEGKSEEARGRERTMSHGSGSGEGGGEGGRKGAKTFVFPEKRRKSSGG